MQKPPAGESTGVPCLGGSAKIPLLQRSPRAQDEGYIDGESIVGFPLTH